MAHKTGDRMTPRFPEAIRFLPSPDPETRPMNADPSLTQNCSYCLRAYRADFEDHASCGCLLCGGFGTVFDGHDETICPCRKHGTTAPAAFNTPATA